MYDNQRPMRIAARRAKHDCQASLRVVISFISKKYAIIAIRKLSLWFLHTDLQYTLQKSSLKEMIFLDSN